MNNASDARRGPLRRPAFTLVELLVVIGIIGILISILLPTIGVVRRQARATKEMSDIRQAMIAYLRYSADHRGALLVGHSPLYGKVHDNYGRPVAFQADTRWPWHLLAHDRYRMIKALYIDERARQLLSPNAENTDMWNYIASLFPSFGLNMYHLGGEFTGPGGTNGQTNAEGWCSRITKVREATRRIVFASARSPGGTSPSDAYGSLSADGGDFVHGHWYLKPPIYQSYDAAGHRWNAPVRWSTASYHDSASPADWGYVHPRCNKKVAVALLDGHAELLSLDDMRDMTRWSNPAAEKGDPNYVSP